MTREEAIKHGKEQLEVFGGTHREFIEMAIQALEQEPYVVNTKDLSDDEIKKFEEVMKNVRVQVIQQEPCEDVISRKDALEPYRVLKDTDTLCVALIRANIMQQKPVTPQQDTVPFDFELYQAGLMDMPKEMIEVLNKIRAEIEFEVDHRNNMLCAEDVFEIIDKYMAESEVQNDTDKRQRFTNHGSREDYKRG